MKERVPLIAGNWKMNLNLKESVALARDIEAGIRDLAGVEVLVAPPFTVLNAVKEALVNSRILLAAQNMHWEMSGAYTGEICGGMLHDAGCTHVILGHSERRMLFAETSEMVDRKVKAAVDLGLIPVLCVGETLEEREAGRTFEVIKGQLDGSLNHFRTEDHLPAAVIVAYEPVWAIGTGRTATPGQAQEMHRFIREWVEKAFESQTARQVRILYGGSVKPGNISDLMEEPDIDGALVGGASLRADSFLKIVHFRQK